jgi:myo-inositol-1(or 4)-monophosphatase
MHAFLNKATAVLRDNGKLILRNYDNLESTIEKASVQTQKLREKLEAKIETELFEFYPKHKFIFSDAITTDNEAEITWHIDVLNGQENFQRGIPHFAMTITIFEKHKPQHAVIYDPLLQECFTATNGQHTQLARKRIRVTNIKELDQALIASNINLDFKPSQQTGCTALQLAYVAAGRLDAFIGTKLSYCELTAGSLLIKVAGGLFSDWQGDNKIEQTGQLIATNKYLLKPLLQNLGK